MSTSAFPFVKPTLSDALSVVLPTEEQTWLLRTCLWSGDPGRQAWAMWRKNFDDPMRFLKQDTAGVKGLLPLLFTALRDNGAPVDTAFQTHLRTAYLRDELRNKLYRQICRDVVATLTIAGIPVIILKGAALADTVYRNPVLQHSHYLDILIKDDDLLRAARSLTPLGFRPLNGDVGSEWQKVEIRHESRLPLLLYRRLFHIPFYDVAMADIWARSHVQHIADIPTRLLSSADNLLHICGSAFYAEQHESLRWVCDSWFLIERCPNLDWDVLLDSCVRCKRLALPLSVTLGYLKEKLNAPIPVATLDRVYAAASRSDTIGREVVLFRARTSTRGGFKRLVRMAGSWRARALVLQWMFFPSPSYLRWVQQISSSWQLPFYYICRPWKYAARRIRWRRKSHTRDMSLQENSTAAQIHF